MQCRISEIVHGINFRECWTHRVAGTYTRAQCNNDYFTNNRVFVRYESNQYSENLKKFSFLRYSVSAVRFLGKKKIYWDLGKCLLCALYATEQSFTLHNEIKSSTNKLYTMYQLTDISGRWSPVDGGYFLCTSP